MHAYPWICFDIIKEKFVELWYVNNKHNVGILVWRAHLKNHEDNIIDNERSIFFSYVQFLCLCFLSPSLIFCFYIQLCAIS